jgi:hypothetical protein
VAGGAAVLIDSIEPVGNQAAIRDEPTIGIDGRKSVPGRKRDDQLAMN